MNSQKNCPPDSVLVVFLKHFENTPRNDRKSAVIHWKTISRRTSVHEYVQKSLKLL